MPTPPAPPAQPEHPADQTGLPKLGSILYQAAVEFPYNAYAIKRVPDQHSAAVAAAAATTESGTNTTSPSGPTAPETSTTTADPSTAADMPHVRKDSGYAGPERVTKGLAISDSLAALCQSGESVSDLLAEDPSLTPGEAWKILLAKSKSSHIPQTQQASHASAATHDKASDNEERLSQDQLDVAFKCGQWGETRPSDLFLRMYHDALCSLNHDPAAGMASPSLLGTSGTVPLVVVSVIPDIVRHMSNLIVRAEKEVILATNFWQASTASRFITDAIREASRRAGQRGTRLTMKIIYDRGSPKQLLDSHYVVQEKEYTGKAVDLPAAHEIPHVDLEIRNIHLIPLGTFHSKFMVVDRKIGIVQSNNIQDNDNLEMMVHVEGPIVDGLYDMALLSWHKKLSPTLPMLSAGSCQAALSTPNGLAAEPSPDEFRHAGPLRFPKREAPYGIGADNIVSPAELVDEHTGKNPVVGARRATTGEAEISSSTGATTTPANSRNASSHQQGLQQHPDADNLAVAQLQITTPGARDATRLAEHTHEDPHYDDDIAGEVARVQAAVSAKPGESQLEAVTRHLNHTVNKGFKGTPPPTSGATTGNHGNTDSIDDDGAMTPYILHPASQPFPIALVNRAPYGPPNHDSVSNPQNAAWLSALRNAKKNVFIQSPTLNAEPLVPAIIEACERGIDVYAYICLGYNDAGELLPMQGGHNEMVAAHLYGRLSTPEARKRLHYHWYTAKDQVAPIPAEKKKRSCHIKLMIVDESIAIVGSGNQDTQSWYHSQEVNIMLESESVCAAWIDGLRRNQNTHRYGALSQEDGIWRDAEGKQADGVMGVDPGKFSWLKGFTGAIKRVQGTGGF